MSDLLYNTVMKNGEAMLWTIEELGERVAGALSAGYGGVPSGRVRDVPDLRTIRYYTTLGLLDRPAEMRGRTALYGQRHLLQLVAIKRLQARGLSLAAVQERVVGLSNAALRRLAGGASPVRRSCQHHRERKHSGEHGWSRNQSIRLCRRLRKRAHMRERRSRWAMAWCCRL